MVEAAVNTQTLKQNHRSEFSEHSRHLQCKYNHVLLFTGYTNGIHLQQFIKTSETIMHNLKFETVS